MKEMMMKRILLVLLLCALPVRAFGAACSENPAGTMTCESFIGRSQSSADGANFFGSEPNDTGLTTNPTCANAATWSGKAQGIWWTDTDESATHTWTACDAGLGDVAAFTSGAITTPLITGNSSLDSQTALEITPRIHIAIDGNTTMTNQMAAIADGIEISNVDVAQLSLIAAGNSASLQPSVRFVRTRGTTTSATSLVQDGDGLGQVYFQGTTNGAEGTAARIIGQVDGSPAGNAIPGRIKFLTTNSSNTETSQLQIDSAGVVAATTSLKSPKLIGSSSLLIYPASNSVTGIQFRKQDGTTNIMTIDTTNNRVGIGIAAPTNILHLSNDGAVPHAILQFNNDALFATSNTQTGFRTLLATDIAASAAHLIIARARNTVNTPQGVQDGDVVGYIAFTAFDGGVERNAVRLYSEIEGAVSSNVVPGRFRFETQNASGTTADRLIIHASGAVTISNLGGGSGTAIVCVDTSGNLSRGTAASCTGS